MEAVIQDKLKLEAEINKIGEENAQAAGTVEANNNTGSVAALDVLELIVDESSGEKEMVGEN